MEDVVGGCSDLEGVVLGREGEEEEERVGFWRPEVFALAGAGEGERERERERGGGGRIFKTQGLYSGS